MIPLYTYWKIPNVNAINGADSAEWYNIRCFPEIKVKGENLRKNGEDGTVYKYFSLLKTE